MTAPGMAQPIPDSYRRVTPCLTVLGAAKALEFYAAVCAAAERRCFPGPGGTILPAEVQIGDSVVMLEDENSQRRTKAPPSGGLPGFPGCLFLDAEDAGTVIACAVELGATLYRPAQDQFCGDRDGYIIDPFGARVGRRVARGGCAERRDGAADGRVAQLGGKA